MKHILLSFLLFPTLFGIYGFGLLPLLLPVPEGSFVSLFSYWLESIYHLVLGYLICIPVTLILSSLIVRKIGNIRAILSYGVIIACLFLFSQNFIGEALVILLPFVTIVHYHSYDILFFWKQRRANSRISDVKE